MITDANGNRLAGDGPTGREIHLVEVVKDGKPTWALAPVGGGFDKVEVVQVMVLTAHGICASIRGDLVHNKAMEKAQDLIKGE